jgi:hypothetical protein
MDSGTRELYDVEDQVVVGDYRPVARFYLARQAIRSG